MTEEEKSEQLERDKEAWGEFGEEVTTMVMTLSLISQAMGQRAMELPAGKGTVVVTTACSLVNSAVNMLTGNGFDSLRGFVMLMAGNATQEHFGTDQECEELFESIIGAKDKVPGAKRRLIKRRDELRRKMAEIGFRRFDENSVFIENGEDPMGAAKKAVAKRKAEPSAQANPNVVH